jgi:hypothetical protein
LAKAWNSIASWAPVSKKNIWNSDKYQKTGVVKTPSFVAFFRDSKDLNTDDGKYCIQKQRKDKEYATYPVPPPKNI